MNVTKFAVSWGVALAALAGLSLPAQGQTVSLLFDATQPGSIKLTTTGSDDYGTGVLNYTSSTGASFAAYCVDLQQDYATQENGYQTFSLGTFSGREASALQGLFSTTFSSVDTTVERAAFQTAVWEITHESSSAAFSVSAGAGSFYFQNLTGGTAADNTSFVNLVNSYLNAAEAYHGPALYELTRLSNPTYQDLVVAQIAPVPEPSRLAMMLAGLGAVGFMAGRRQRR
ncbi:PEP-CTERM sorting domain-containing protein [Mitsuaria sp. WAJ17]|uniref:PEP-CTERM sorting domain-containing protein n=1 Tax=Mitsuaria sp. WAJ17 TaxID=2761452 RepID=UPI001600BBF7|nr:PEP-CTERM sorting domain-containing protein [Mitsuaria sp. WAJ17]MBB2484633.1 PEP-CTERM sorting domain-containing protein [Mitsuaria sp. WAJ17]